MMIVKDCLSKLSTFIFNVSDSSRCELIELQGIVKDYVILCSVNCIAELTMKINTPRYKILKKHSEDATLIITLPNVDGCLRVFGFTTIELNKNSAILSAKIKSFHHSYEDACAYEMKERLKIK